MTDLIEGGDAASGLSVVERLHAMFRHQASLTRVRSLIIGLSYTAVETDEGEVGLGFTMLDANPSSQTARGYRDFEGEAADELLDCALSSDTLQRSMGVALINALNRSRALTMPPDVPPSGGLMNRLHVEAGKRIAMVGYFPPIARRMEAAGATVHVLDRDLNMGDEGAFLAELPTWPDAVIVTGTTILNGTLEPILERVPQDAEVVLLGPTTPLVPEAFRDLPVTMLGGMVSLDNQRVLSAVRQGAGTPSLSPYCRKVMWSRPVSIAARQATNDRRGACDA